MHQPPRVGGGWTERNIPYCGLKMFAVSLGGDTMANVAAIGAEEMGDLSKGSETKWITVRQCCSPDTRPPFPGSPSDLLGFVGGPNEWTDGWIDVLKNKYAVMPLHKQQVCHEQWPRRVEKGALHSFAGAGRCPVWSASPRRWGAPSQKVYAMTVNHILPPRERARLLALRGDPASGPSAAMRTRNLFLIMRAWATQSEVGLTSIWTMRL